MTKAPTTDAEAFARAVAFDRAVHLRAARRAVRHPWGWAMSDDRFPQTWTMNTLRVTEALGDDVTPAAFDAEVARVYAGRGHRRVLVEDAATGRRLAVPLTERGWSATEEVVMALREPRDREAEPGLAREVEEGPMQAVEVESMLEDDDRRLDPGGRAVAEQIIRARAELRAGMPRSRRFVGSWDGRDGAVASLFADGRTAQVEAVGTVTPLRGHGLARAVVCAAVDAALADGHDFVFILAESEDWPKELYAKLGFRAVGTVWAFNRG